MLIDRYFNEGDSVLDIACGAGRTAIPLAQKGFKVTAIDFLLQMLEIPRLRAQQLAEAHTIAINRPLALEKT